MASNCTGKVIDKIKYLKKKVSITFTNGSKLDVLQETYTNFYLYEGKTLTTKEIKEIKKMDELNAHLPYAIKTATSHLMTEGQLKSKLYKRGCTKSIVEQIIKLLKKNDIINDEGYILDYLEYANEKLYGELKIKQDLFTKGLSKERIEKIRFNKSNELKKAKKLVSLFEIKLKDKSYPIRKEKIYNALQSKGFTRDIALEAVSSVKLDKNDKLIEEEIKLEINRWMRLNEHKYENEYELKTKLVAHLKNKGYSYNKINQMWGEYYEHND